MRKLGDKAVVLGAGMAGLLAAGVLADFYDSVAVIERDVLPDDATQRKGVPQGRHAHMFLSSGTQTLDRLFPGLLDDLVADGATVCDEGDLSRIRLQVGTRTLFNRSEKLADPESFRLYLASRPFLEAHLLHRVRALENVRILDAHDAIGPIADEPHRVTGVRVMAQASQTESTIDADLVVDAMGRGARTPAFLEAAGYERPMDSRATSDIGYSSLLLRIPGGVVAEKIVAVRPSPEIPWYGMFLAYENDTMMMTLGGIDGLIPPVDFPGMITLARTFAPDSMLTALSAAQPLGDVCTYRYRNPVWRRYDRLRRFPEALLVIGDALCSLDPVYGQGMTLAALEADALRDCLAHGDADLAHRFFAATTAQIETVWQSNNSFPLRTGSPTRGLRKDIAQRLTQWWMNKVLSAAERDMAITEALLRVQQLLDPPAKLARPGFLFRVARHAVST